MGAEFTRALQGLGQTFGDISQQMTARKRQQLIDARQAEQDKLAMDYQQAQIGNLDRDNARLDAAAAAEQATKAANTSRMAELNPILGEYPILRGAPSGEGRYNQLSDTIKPQIDSSAFGITPKTGMGAPTAENPYDISKFSKQATGAMEISPALASLRSEDLRKSQLAGLSPQQLKFKTGIAGSSLPADINAAKNLDDLQKYEDEMLKMGKADERYEREFNYRKKSDEQDRLLKKQAVENDFLKATVKSKGDSVKAEMDLSDKFNKDSRKKTVEEIRTSNRSLQAAWESYNSGDKKSLGAVDQALITLYNKMLDPGSVVRESEYARTPENMAYMDSLAAKLEKFKKGGAGLDDKFRQELVGVASTLMGAAEEGFASTVEDYINNAKAWELSPERIVGSDMAIYNKYRNKPTGNSVGRFKVVEE